MLRVTRLSLPASTMPSPLLSTRLRLTSLPFPSKDIPVSGWPDTEFRSIRLSFTLMTNMPMSPLSATWFLWMLIPLE